MRHAAHAHGTVIQLENSAWSALRRAAGTFVRPSTTSTSGWVHFPVTAPVVANDVRLALGTVWVRFNMGSRASIDAIEVYDGASRIMADTTHRTTTGESQNVRLAVADRPPFFTGLLVSFLVNFNGAGPDAWIQFIAAGGDFFDGIPL